LLLYANAAAALTPTVGISGGETSATLGESRELAADNSSPSPRQAPRFSSATPSVCTLSPSRKKEHQPAGNSSAVVHFNATGTCTIVASVEAGGEYEAAEARISFVVTESNKQKLAKALKVCKKDTSKSKRKKCRAAARKRYQKQARREAEEQKRREAEEKPKREAEEKKRLEEEVRAKREGEEKRKFTATLIVHVYRAGTIPLKNCAEAALHFEPGVELECNGNELTERRPEESVPLVITRLGVGGEVRETSEHKVHVAPGAYEVALNDYPQVYKKQEVTVSEGQTVEVRLVIIDEG
jgi:hypothetical protein